MARQFDFIDVERIFLYEENPRHEPIESEPEIIDYLCKDEQVYNLARSISEAGPNPLELIGVVETGDAKGAKKNYQVWEGNRRVCAIKLLNDPDLAPAHLRKDFSRLATNGSYKTIKKINAVIFDDHNDLKFWMGVTHNGAQAGVGRLDWDAQQKARHFGSGRNRVALAILDAAEVLGLMTKDEREGKLTTAQRFLNSSIVREAIGIDTTNRDDITVTRPTNDLKQLLTRFITDLKNGTKITSRHNRNQIDTYGRGLARNVSISGDRIQPVSLQTALAAAGDGGKKNRKSATGRKSKKRRKRDKIEFEKDLQLALEKISNDKLEALYFSLCNVSLESHAPLLCIGAWAFVESLSAVAGKGDADFLSFYSNQRFSDLGFTDKKKRGVITDALTRISRNGNATKHHEVAANFHGKQLANDLATITPLLVKTLENFSPKK